MGFRVTDRAYRGSPRSSFCPGDHDPVRFCLGYTGGDGSHATLGYEFHADLGLRVHVLQIEDQLRQVLDRVNIVVRWGEIREIPGIE